MKNQLDNPKSIIAWSFYDWANSAFITTIVVAFFIPFFKDYLVGTMEKPKSTLYLGMANSIASLIIACLAPFIGAIADKGSAKKKFLIIFAFLGILNTFAMSFLQRGYWQIAIFFYVIANVGFYGSNIFYDSLLPGVASKKRIDFVSSLGFSLGYAGGGLLLLLNILMFKFPGIFGISNFINILKTSFPGNNWINYHLNSVHFIFFTVGIWWAIFSIPVIIFVKEPKIYEKTSILNSIKFGWKQLIETLQNIKHLKIVGLFLLAYWLYIDGVDTIVKMAVDYGKNLNFSTSSLITAILLVQFIGFPCAIFYNFFGKIIGVKKAVLAAIAAYTVITIFGYFMKTERDFYILAVMVAVFQGGIQALSRSLFSRIIPKNKSAEFYGFYNMLGKFAAIIGPLLIGLVTWITGSPRIGIISVIFLFISGGILLFFVDIKTGEKIAENFLSKN